ncbi:encapsulin [Bacillus sp. FSL W8-0223]|jgi:hypothetical protein|uniref:DUF2184 domain-containing protein n=1 Tax=Bacillus sp. FSL W8-0223 TaxID=2954595 RepID=UPI0030FBF69F
MGNEVQATLSALDLQQIDSTLYEPKAEELTARTVFPLKTDIHPGAETYGYNVMTRSGAAKIVANGADDIPLVDTDIKRETAKIYSIMAAFHYTQQELRANQLAGTSVDTTKAATVRRAIAEKENKIAWIGDSDYGLVGVVNAPGIQTVAVDQGSKGSTKWKDKDGNEILEDIRKTRAKITILPGYGSASLVLAVPPAQFEELNRRYSDYDARSIMKVVEDNQWFTKIVRVPDLVGVGTNGSDSMLIFNNDPETIQLVLPMDLTRYPEEYKFPRVKVPCEERCGGVIIRFPYAVVRGDGI